MLNVTQFLNPSRVNNQPVLHFFVNSIEPRIIQSLGCQMRNGRIQLGQANQHGRALDHGSSAQKAKINRLSCRGRSQNVLHVSVVLTEPPLRRCIIASKLIPIPWGSAAHRSIALQLIVTWQLEFAFMSCLTTATLVRIDFATKSRTVNLDDQLMHHPCANLA